jgi:hypothetical protein
MKSILRSLTKRRASKSLEILARIYFKYNRIERNKKKKGREKHFLLPTLEIVKLLSFHMPGLATRPYMPNKEAW